VETSRIKIKIGIHEFEAEGPTELVQSQFESFKELIASQPKPIVNPPSTEQKINSADGDESKSKYDKIFKIEARIVSLTASPQTVSDAALLIMLGQKQYRSNDTVTGQEVGDGLDHSGVVVSRVDRVMDSFILEGSVMKIGQGRATRYRLTNTGLNKAIAIADQLVATLPE
jgi:hypothetical protein